MPWLDIATGQFKDDHDGCVISGKLRRLFISPHYTERIQTHTKNDRERRDVERYDERIGESSR